MNGDPCLRRDSGSYLARRECSSTSKIRHEDGELSSPRYGQGSPVAVDDGRTTPTQTRASEVYTPTSPKHVGDCPVLPSRHGVPVWQVVRVTVTVSVSQFTMLRLTLAYDNR